METGVSVGYRQEEVGQHEFGCPSPDESSKNSHVTEQSPEGAMEKKNGAHVVWFKQQITEG